MTRKRVRPSLTRQRVRSAPPTTGVGHVHLLNQFFLDSLSKHHPGQEDLAFPDTYLPSFTDGEEEDE